MMETELSKGKIGVIRRAFWCYKNYCWDSDPITGEEGVFGRDYGCCHNREDCPIFVRTACKKISESLLLIDEDIGLVTESMNKVKEYIEKD